MRVGALDNLFASCGILDGLSLNFASNVVLGDVSNDDTTIDLIYKRSRNAPVTSNEIMKMGVIMRRNISSCPIFYESIIFHKGR